MNNSNRPTAAAFSHAELSDAVRDGTRAVALLQIASQLLSVASLVILLHLIPPTGYGLIGMVLPVFYFLRIFTKLGLNVATVQSPHLSTAEINALFWFNMLLGCATTAAAVALAPAMAWFYREPQLIPIGLAMAGLPLLAAWGTQHQALLERKMLLGRVAGCRLAAQFGAAVAAIAVALADGRVWALVAQQYGEMVIFTALMWKCETWRPDRPARTVSVAKHLRLGAYYSASTIVFYLAGNLDKILIGRVMGEYALGLYSQAFNLILKPVYLVTDPLASIILSALSRASDTRVRQALVEGFYRLTAIALFPAGVGLMLVGDVVIDVLGGEQWHAAGPLISVMGAAIVAQGYINITGPIFTAAGRTGRMLWGACVLTLVLTQAYVAGWWIGKQHGYPLLGVAWGYTLATVLVLFIPYTLYCLWTTGYRARPIFGALLRPALAAAGMGVLVGMLRPWLAPLPLALQLAVEISVGVASYALFAWSELVWLYRQLGELRRP